MATKLLSLKLTRDTGPVGGINTDGITFNGQIDVLGLDPSESWEYRTSSTGPWLTGVGSSFILGEGVYATGAIQVRRILAGNQPSTEVFMVLDLNGNGVHTVNKLKGVMFDVAATGEAVLTGWTDGEDGLLALDLNGDGKINDGSELFGNATRTANGKASDGYVALRQYDLNADGVINTKDAVFGKLQVWADTNMDGVSQAGELHSLQQVGVESLSLDALSSTQTENGNLFAMTSSWTGKDGKVHDMADVWFANSSLEQLVQNASDTQKLDLDTDPTANVKNVHLSDVLGLDSQVMVIKAGTNDVVNIDHTGWTHSDLTTTFDNHTYALWNNGNAHLLIDQNAQVHQVI